MTRPTTIDACALALASREGPKPGQKWIHVLPSGTFAGRDGRGPYHAADPAAIMQTSRHIAGRTAIPVDYEHQIDMAVKNGRPAPAAGWITGLQSRSDGIWGLVEWTARASRHLAEREYRYLSPAFTHTRDGRVTAILRASLVNNPNLDQLTALASMESPRMDDLTDLLTELELPADAGMAAIIAEVRALKTQRMSAGAPDPAKFVPIGDYTRLAQELHRVHQGVELQAAKQHVEEAFRKGHLLGFQKDWAIQLCCVNKPAFDKYCEEAGQRLSLMLKGPSGASARPPSFAGRSDLDGTEAEVASKLGLTPEQFNGTGGK